MGCRAGNGLGSGLRRGVVPGDYEFRGFRCLLLRNAFDIPLSAVQIHAYFLSSSAFFPEMLRSFQFHPAERYGRLPQVIDLCGDYWRAGLVPRPLRVVQSQFNTRQLSLTVADIRLKLLKASDDGLRVLRQAYGSHYVP